jgi:hypothetical protein
LGSGHIGEWPEWHKILEEDDFKAYADAVNVFWSKVAGRFERMR